MELPDTFKKLVALVILCICGVCVHIVLYPGKGGGLRHIIAPKRHLASYYERIAAAEGDSGKPVIKSPEDSLSNVTQRLIERKQRMQQVCKSDQQRIHKEQQNIKESTMYQKYYAKQPRVIVDETSKIAICLQAKGGSTFWKNFYVHKALTSVGGVRYSEEKRISGVRFMSLEQFKLLARMYAEQNYTIYTFGRNPWNRLVSLYRQKIESKSLDTKERKYVKAACLKTPQSTFDDLLRCVIRTTEAGGPVIPDRHWEPLTTRCGLCDVSYHFIGKVEYMNEESQTILTSAGLLGNISHFLDDVRTGSIRAVEQQHVSQRVDYRAYYKNISSDIIQRIRDIYQSDLDLLGYPDSPL